MSILESFVDAVTGGGVEVVDLTAPLSAETPVIQLPRLRRSLRAACGGGRHPWLSPRSAARSGLPDASSGTSATRISARGAA